MDTPQTDIYIVGTGMVGYRQLTQEAIGALEQVERIYLIHYQELVYEYMENFADDIVNLTSVYEQNENRSDTYETMAETVLSGAKECEGSVALALYGHPLVFVSPSRWIVERAPDRGLSVDVRPGISSMDCLYVDLMLDPAESGIQMIEATDLLVREYELNPDIATMIWQIGVVESSLYSKKESSPERFSRLRNYLQQFYPHDHTAYIVKTATYPITESEQIEFKLSEFESIHDQINAVHTLYIPPVRQRPIQNEALARQVQSSEHLETITKSE